MKDIIAWAEELSRVTNFDSCSLRSVIVMFRANNVSDEKILNFIKNANNTYISSNELHQISYTFTGKAKQFTTDQLRVLAGKKPYNITI